MNTTTTYSAFAGETCIGTGDLRTVIDAALKARSAEPQDQLLFFRHDTGKQVDFDLRGSVDEVLERIAPPPKPAGRGRPRLGVVCNEICLLPRHWEWLERQPHRPSAVLRRLIDTAMKNRTPAERERERMEAAHAFMWTMAGNKVGFEEASRALYARKWEVFRQLIALWPEDIVATIERLLEEGENGVTDRS